MAKAQPQPAPNDSDFCNFYSKIPALVGAGTYFKIPKLYYNYHTLESIFVDTDTGNVIIAHSSTPDLCRFPEARARGQNMPYAEASQYW